MRLLDTGLLDSLVNTVADKRPFMTPFLFQVDQYLYHDDSPKVHISTIITSQSKIPSFVLKHLASYTLANYPKRAKIRCL